MKTTTGITVDPETLRRFKDLVGRGNFSSTLEKMMEARLGASNSVSVLDIEIAKIDLEAKEKLLREVTAEANDLKEKLDASLDAQKTQELEILKAEQERQKIAGSCLQCHGSLTGSKAMKVRTGYLCHGCFAGLPPSRLSELL